MNRFRPADFQPELPLGQLIVEETPDEAVELDVLFVGGGPAGLAGAIELASLAQRDAAAGGALGDIGIGVLEKAEALGEHSLSGAVVNPRALRELFPDLADADLPLGAPVAAERVYFLTADRAVRIPTPPTMRNEGCHVASLCEVVRWLGERAEGLGVNIFTGYPAGQLLVEGERVVGVRTTPSGLDRDGAPGASFGPPTDLTAQVTALAEGTRGALAQAYLGWRGIGAANPQIYALGVKELWETRRPLDHVIHTLGWPLPTDAFGGSFMYPLEPNVLALGLVVGLDAPDASLDVHALLQHLKHHPMFRPYLEGGELAEWGAKTIPEGGYYSVPERRSGDGVVVLGDSAGLVDVPSLKGVHYAVQSGIYAARAIFAALKAGDTSAEALAEYDKMVNTSYIMTDLHRTRNVRLGFKDGLLRGGVKAALATLTGGRAPGARIAVESDAHVERRAEPTTEASTYEGALAVSKVDAVFKSGNATRDTIPQHLVVGDDVPPEVARFYSHMCPAGVYEVVDGMLRVNAPNCVDCKATDIVGPRWTPREGGSGPKYRRM